MRLSIILLPLTGFVQLISGTYTTVHSQANPGHSLRVKEHANGSVCNGGGKHFTGWADIGDRHLFYWYHPTRNGPEQDAPLLVWLQGGPGASSMLGMLALNGPCLLNAEKNITEFNPYSWNELYNVLYLDQPAGVGLSYVDDSKNRSAYPRRTEESAQDFVAVAALLKAGFPQFAGMDWLIAGESYGGRYAPTYGAAVLEYNERVPKDLQIPLRSVVIGDGWTNPKDQYPSLYDVSCYEVDNIPPILNSTECASLATVAAKCEKLMEACVATPEETICGAAGNYCQANMVKPIEGRNNNVYDRTVICPGPEEADCYPFLLGIQDFMHTDKVQEVLEIKSETGGRANFVTSQKIIEERYMESADFFTSSAQYVEKLLDAGIKVLVYVGINDWYVNNVGVERMLGNLRFDGYVDFRAQAKAPVSWNLKNGRSAGRVKSTESLSFVELAGAGHLVPHDQPESALELMKAWKKEMVGSMIASKSLSQQGVVPDQAEDQRAQQRLELRSDIAV